MSIKGLIFDFDGLILETEVPLYEIWQDIYHQHGTDLSLPLYARCLGASLEAFDPLTNLEEVLGGTLPDREKVLSQFNEDLHTRIFSQPPIPGVVNTLQSAKRLGLKLAVASSGDVPWVKGHLERLGLTHFFDHIFTRENVERVKPAPDLFIKAQQALGVQPHEAIVFEDSPNGVTAAKAAGIHCVAVPNLLTAQLDLSHADLILQPMDQLPLEGLLARFNGHLA